jgi:predicted Zn finger-like uncharacterized protein
MSWITRCPACGVTYWVVPDQLKLAHGWLRCCQCQHAFDSTGLVIDSTDAGLNASPAVLAKHSGANSGAKRVAIDDFLIQEDRTAAVQPVPAVAEFDAALSTFNFQHPPEQASSVGALPTNGTPPEALSPALRSSRSMWQVMLVVSLALTLVIQWTWVGRYTLLTSVPELTQPMKAACQLWGCDLAPQARPDGVVIETSSLTPRDGVYVLTWAVRNVTTQSLQMPTLELSLKDAQDKALVRRVLPIADQGAPSDLAAGDTWRGQLHLLLAEGLEPLGYRLLIFYP